jgi:muramoyltetrapeptide carboxypeptidase
VSKKIIPPKLLPGDTICVIAPSKSLSTITKKQRTAAEKKLNEIGLNVIYGKHVEEIDEFNSSSVASRIADLHKVFEDKKVKGILAAAGGFNSNQLLRYIDWELIGNNPKIFCGYSDITTLLTAIYTKTGLITYSSPNFSSFGDPVHGDYTTDYFVKCLMQEKPFVVKPASTWSNSKWEEKWSVRTNEGFWVMQEGEYEGKALGENLVTLNFLKGTEYFPNLENSILFLEDDFNNSSSDFDEHLQSLIIDREFKNIKGIVFGRFQEQSKITREVLHNIVSTKSELRGMPIIANCDFGHTEPKFTFPFGGTVKIVASKHSSLIQILEH